MWHQILRELFNNKRAQTNRHVHWVIQSPKRKEKSFKKAWAELTAHFKTL